MRPRSRRLLVVCVTAAILLGSGAMAAAWHFGIWGWNDLEAYRMMARECHPVWRELQSGRIHAGQPVDEVIAATGPITVNRFGRYSELGYQRASFTGVTMVARDGRLVHAAAWSCTWTRTFFDTLTDAEKQDYGRAYREHLLQRKK